MPTAPEAHVEPDRPRAEGQAGAAGPDRRRVVMVPDGPVLIDGPVEIELPDGSRVVSDRFVVALCVCRRSRRYPLCDTSHRRKVRAEREPRPPQG